MPFCILGLYTDILWMHHATSFFKVSVLRAEVFWMRPVRTIRSRHPDFVEEHGGSIDYATIFYFDLHSWESSKAPEVQVVTWTDTKTCVTSVNDVGQGLVVGFCWLFIVWFDSCLLLLATTGNQEADLYSGVSWVYIILINSVSDFRVCVCVQWADIDLRGTMPILHFLREVEKFDQGRQLGISCWGSSSKSVGALHHCSGAAGFSCGNDLWSLGTIVKVKLWFGTSGTTPQRPCWHYPYQS